MNILKEEKAQVDASMLLLIGGAVLATLVVAIILKDIVTQAGGEVEERT